MGEIFILNGNTSDFTACQNSVTLDPNKKYEAALVSLDTYNQIPNITAEKNNIFSYSIDNGETWKNIVFKTGAYELVAINNEIKREMIANGDSGNAIDIFANISRLTSIVSIENPLYRVNFDVNNSIGYILGFGAVQIGPGYNESPKIVNIMPVNSILVNIDIIMGSYARGLPSSVIYSFYPNVAPGYKIVERPNKIYCPVSRDDISRIRVWLTDQDGNLVDLRGETITISICIREFISRSIIQDMLNEVREIKKYLKNKL